MHHEGIHLGRVIGQWTMPQPSHQLLTIGCRQYLVQGVFATDLVVSIVDCQQVQVMIAQHRDSVLAETPDKAQRGEGIRPPVDQVPGKPEAVRGGIEGYLIQQALQRVQAPLDIADGVIGHLQPSLTAAIR